MKTKARWSWKRWLDALDRSDLSQREKDFGRQFAVVAKKTKRRPVVPWDFPVDTAPTYDAFSPLITAGLCYLIPGEGRMIAIYEPLPAANSIDVNPEQRRILGRLKLGGRLYHINRSGYITPRNSRIRWVLYHRGDHGKTWPVTARACNRLATLGLIEPDGCGHGWPYSYTSSYRLRERRVAGVRGFRGFWRRWHERRGALGR